MSRTWSRRMTMSLALAGALGVSACATTDEMFDDPLFWQAVSLAAEYAAYDAMLDNCDWYASPHGGSYRLCGKDRPPRRHRHRPHRPHR